MGKKEKDVIDLGDIGEDELQKLGIEEEPSAEIMAEDPIVENSMPEEKEMAEPVVNVIKSPREGPRLDPKVIDLENKISGVESMVTQFDSSLANVRQLQEESNEKIDSMEKTVQSLLSIYELVTRDMNPFVEDDNTKMEVPSEASGVFVKSKTKEPAMEERLEAPGGREVVKSKSIEQEGPQVKVLERSEELVKKPPLGDIDTGPPSEITLIKWLDFLSKRAEHGGILEILTSYEGMEWITPAIKDKMLSYSKHVNSGAMLGKEPYMGIEDHVISLFFIAKLRGIKVNMNHLGELGLLE